MKPFFVRNAPVFYSLVAMLVLYTPWMGRGYVNLEYPFSMAARALSDSSQSGLIDSYFAVQANPLGYSFVLAVLYKIVGYHDWFWLAKLPSLSGGLMIIIAGWMLTRERWANTRSLFYFWSGLVILNPLIIAFATASTADVLPVGLLMLALAIAMEGRKKTLWRALVASSIFGLAVITKYVPAYFGAAFLVTAIIGENREVFKSKWAVAREIAVYVLVPGSILAIYIWWVNTKYGVFISSGFVVGRPNIFDFQSLSTTFAKYLSFVGLCIGVTSVIVCFERFRFTKSRVFLLTLAISTSFINWYALSNRVMGEMNFGGGFPFNNLVRRVIETFGLLSGVALCVVLYVQVRGPNKTHKILIAGLVPYLVLISATRPTQRYLIYAIPIVLLLLVDAASSLPKKVFNLSFGFTLLGFGAVSLLGMSYLRAQGNAAENMAVWMEKNKVINESAAGILGVHAGQHFYGLVSKETKYEVVTTSLEGEKAITEKILHREPMNVLGRITRVYVLRELPKAP